MRCSPVYMASTLFDTFLHMLTHLVLFWFLRWQLDASMPRYIFLHYGLLWQLQCQSPLLIIYDLLDAIFYSQHGKPDACHVVCFSITVPHCGLRVSSDMAIRVPLFSSSYHGLRLQWYCVQLILVAVFCVYLEAHFCHDLHFWALSLARHVNPMLP